MERSRAPHLGVRAVMCAVGLTVTPFYSTPIAGAQGAKPGTQSPPRPHDARSQPREDDAQRLLGERDTARAASEGIDLPETDALPGVVVFAARAPGPRPISVLLHGMCGDAARACSHFAVEVTANANLVCPRAAQRCSGGGSSWPERGVAEAVEAAIARAQGALREPVDETQGRTLIGYSMGAFRAVGIAQHGAGRYRRLMLIGAKVSLDQGLLARNGVGRVLFCAGSWDMMHDPMRRETERLRRAGLAARFLDLGPVGHAFTASFANYLPEALTWLSGD